MCGRYIGASQRKGIGIGIFLLMLSPTVQYYTFPIHFAHHMFYPLLLLLSLTLKHTHTHTPPSQLLVFLSMSTRLWSVPLTPWWPPEILHGGRCPILLRAEGFSTTCTSGTHGCSFPNLDCAQDYSFSVVAINDLCTSTASARASVRTG